MSRINTNVSSLIAQRVLRKNNNSLNNSLARLSTGLKINSGADNPAGLIASENLRAEKAGIQQAIENAGRASNIIGTAEGGLSEVSTLLTELQNLVSQSANTGGLSQEQISKVVTQSQSAFQTCIEQELRKNPNLKIGKFFIRATIANSGVVKAAAIDHRNLKGTALTATAR